ncbi:glutamate racemase [Corynebacterium sp. 319]|uniref:glutamate racemase n=1 Tax=unclassified Corynebacterium TaxID=2624378 RepID=UPI00125CA744|nr:MULTISPECIES: glutamate racemase [unclassified Corynebacterium]KAB1551444.1 glutamate racemase [Corynebacterium sp. 321]KAB1551728.1 glutamate racemase [Corynebacterium sp. 319]KAB3538718.1 glutamate racemase [Corynebacterium sp. 366]
MAGTRDNWQGESQHGDNQHGDNRPIGVFDSGVGGLTVARTIADLLPHENLTYIGDTENSPYGDKPQELVRHLSLNIAHELADRGCKMIVIACNTATAASFHDVREQLDIPVVEVITPAVRRAVSASKNNKVGVIATQGTVSSHAYRDMFQKLSAVDVVEQACPQFVPFVERGITAGRQIMGLAENYLQPLKDRGVDTVVLGCTHYPLLAGVVQLVMGDNVTLVNSAEETAKTVFRTLSERDMLATEGNVRHLSFESTGDPQRFANLATRFLGPGISSVSHIPESFFNF